MEKAIKLILLFLMMNLCGMAQVTSATDSMKDKLPATPPPISGKGYVCSGSTETYSITSVANATSYFWLLPKDWSGTSTSTSITVKVGSMSGGVSVLSKNDVGYSKVLRTFPVNVALIPPQPGKIKGDTAVCGESVKTFSIDDVQYATFYTWTLPSDWKGTSTTSTITLTSGTKSGTISVSAGNMCGSSPARKAEIKIIPIPDQPGKISREPSEVGYKNNIYSIELVKGTTSYTWTLPEGWEGTSTKNKIQAIPGTSGGIITVKANNNCGSSTPAKLEVGK